MATMRVRPESPRTADALRRGTFTARSPTAAAAEHAARDLARSGGGLGEYYSERETRTAVWVLAGHTHTVATMVGVTDAQCAGGDADAELVTLWLDEGAHRS